MLVVELDEALDEPVEELLDSWSNSLVMLAMASLDMFDPAFDMADPRTEASSSAETTPSLLVSAGSKTWELVSELELEFAAVVLVGSVESADPTPGGGP
jgi:hypothetical protein